MNPVLAIDPGPERSAYLEYFPSTHTVTVGDITNNNNVLYALKRRRTGIIVIEWIESYGMAVGASIFETVYWIGRFRQAADMARFERVTRREVKLYLCNSARAKDTNIRQSLLDKFGGTKQAAIGTKKQPGPLYGIKTHLWAALAVAITYAGRNTTCPNVKV